MHKRIWIIGLTAMATVASAQTIQRRANITGGGDPDHGRCIIGVVVDGAAEVEVRRDSANLRDLSGRQPEWRRFECTSPLPRDARNFRFSGMNGRGSQELVRGPESGGAVVRIQDSQGGASEYTFMITWGEGDRGSLNSPDRQGPPPAAQRYTTEQAVQVCQDAVRRQAGERFHADNISFRRTNLDDNPGRQDFVTGIMDIRRGYDHDEMFRFSCSVNFDTGEVRSAQIDPLDRDRYARGNDTAGPSPAQIAMTSCRRSVEERLRGNGYQHVDFISINVDDRPGRNDWIVGVARSDSQSRSDTFSFNCSVDLRDGDVRSVDVHRRRDQR